MRNRKSAGTVRRNNRKGKGSPWEIAVEFSNCAGATCKAALYKNGSVLFNMRPQGLLPWYYEANTLPKFTHDMEYVRYYFSGLGLPTNDRELLLYAAMRERNKDRWLSQARLANWPYIIEQLVAEGILKP